MSRTDITPTAVAATGTTDTLSAANADGSAFFNNGRTWVEVANASGGPINVTIQTPRTVDGLAVADQVVAVADGTRKKIGPFPADTYNIQSGDDAGQVYIDFSGVSSVTVGVWRLD